MNFDLSEDQHQIKRTARELLASRSTWEKVRGAAEAGRYDDDLFKEVSELGWPGIAISEENGGQGLGMVELAAVLEELGYACAVTPFLGTVLAALMIEHAGSSDQRSRWLPSLASGEARGALGTVDELVPDAPGADVVVLADSEAGTATLIEGSDAVEEVASIDPTRRYGRVEAGAEPERLPIAAAMAKTSASDGGRAVTGDAIQLHGGIGFTWEADLHWLFKRAQLDSRFLGGAGTHRARIARLAVADRTAAV